MHLTKIGVPDPSLVYYHFMLIGAASDYLRLRCRHRRRRRCGPPHAITASTASSTPVPPEDHFTKTNHSLGTPHPHRSTYNPKVRLHYHRLRTLYIAHENINCVPEQILL